MTRDNKYVFKIHCNKKTVMVRLLNAFIWNRNIFIYFLIVFNNK